MAENTALAVDNSEQLSVRPVLCCACCVCVGSLLAAGRGITALNWACG
jgi:hypothetical protein